MNFLSGASNSFGRGETVSLHFHDDAWGIKYMFEFGSKSLPPPEVKFEGLRARERDKRRGRRRQSPLEEETLSFLPSFLLSLCLLNFERGGRESKSVWAAQSRRERERERRNVKTGTGRNENE